MLLQNGLYKVRVEQVGDVMINVRLIDYPRLKFNTRNLIAAKLGDVIDVRLKTEVVSIV